MSEAEWRDNPHIFELIGFFESQVGNRRRRLFACACCRRVWNMLHQRVSAQVIVELAEAFADGQASEAELRAAHEHYDFSDLQAQLVGRVTTQTQLSLLTLHSLAAVQDLTSPNVSVLQLVLNTSKRFSDDYIPSPQHNEGTGGGGSVDYDTTELFIKENLLRDILGNPFRPVTFEPVWRTQNTVGIATKMYDERNFDAMPILADALEDSGCDNEEILRHCREPGIHVRGCWVVDLVLGKE